MISPSLQPQLRHNFLGLSDHSGPQSALLSFSSNTAFISSMSLDTVWTLAGHLQLTITNGQKHSDRLSMTLKQFYRLADTFHQRVKRICIQMLFYLKVARTISMSHSKFLSRSLSKNEGALILLAIVCYLKGCKMPLAYKYRPAKGVELK